jgi:hypothetical protein
MREVTFSWEGCACPWAWPPHSSAFWAKEGEKLVQGKAIKGKSAKWRKKANILKVDLSKRCLGAIPGNVGICQKSVGKFVGNRNWRGTPPSHFLEAEFLNTIFTHYEFFECGMRVQRKGG